MKTETTQLIEQLEAGPVGQILAIQDENGIERMICMSVFTWEQIQATRARQMRVARGVDAGGRPTRAQRRSQAQRKRQQAEARKKQVKAQRRREHERNRAAKIRKKMPRGEVATFNPFR